MKILRRISLTLWIICVLLLHTSLHATPRKLSIKLRGVYDSRITLTPFDGLGMSVPLTIVPDVKNGSEVQLSIPESLLPGEFLVRFDYRLKETDNLYPVDLQLFINRENIQVNANPLYLQGDSLQLTGDRENKAWFTFMNKSEQKRQQIGLLRRLLEQYDQPTSPVWIQARKAYEERRVDYNRWISSQISAQKDLYVSHLYGFHYIKAENWNATPAARMDELALNWFKDINLRDTLILRSRQMSELMDGFMGLYGSRSTTEALRDSFFTEAGKVAIGAAASRHPRVYGWMVDYFYNGYETYNIVPGLKMLEEHLNNPGCLTSKRIAIAKRLEGIRTLIPGVKVNSVKVHNVYDQEETIDMNRCIKKHRLLVFYDSECDHCRTLLASLRSWYAVPANNAKLEVVSVAVDHSREVWESAFAANAFPWTDRYAPGGVNSKAASDYYVLSAPSMFLMDKNGILVSAPSSIAEVESIINKE